jgi:hypothetical protein
MRRQLLLVLLALGLWSLLAGAVTREDFLAQTAQDLLHLCAASPTEPLYTAAINFCQGYWVGAYQYHEAATSGPEGKALLCPRVEAAAALEMEEATLPETCPWLATQVLDGDFWPDA